MQHIGVGLQVTDISFSCLIGGELSKGYSLLLLQRRKKEKERKNIKISKPTTFSFQL